MTTSIFDGITGGSCSTPSEGREVRIADLQAGAFLEPGSEAGV